MSDIFDFEIVLEADIPSNFISFFDFEILFQVPFQSYLITIYLFYLVVATIVKYIINIII